VTFGQPVLQMFDSHTAQVNVTGHFSQNPTTFKSLAVTATINGTSVSTALHSLLIWGAQIRS